MIRITAIPRASRGDGTAAFSMVGLGTFADMMTVDEASVVKVETDLPDEQLALVGCGVTTGVGAALVCAEVQPGSSVGVVGCGGVGLSVIQGSRIAGAVQIIAVDPIESRRVAAVASGATAVIDPGDGDVLEQVRSLTGGRGVDYSFEVVGRPSTTHDAISMARPGGTVVIVGAPGPTDRLDLSLWDLFIAQKTVKTTRFGSVHIRRDIPRFVALAEAGLLDLASLITGVVPLETETVNQAFEALESGTAVRTVFTP
jgi:S-(hydroxymethyl)glutathione dehydrogenase/alcohol dehydrogenase